MRTPDLQDAVWRKSSHSGGNGGECVELAHDLDAIRDSKNPDGPTLLRVDLAGFLTAVKADSLGR